MIVMTGKTQVQLDTESAIEAQQKIIADNTAILDATRYHVDIAFENGESVFPAVAAQRVSARAAIAAAKEVLKGL